jgi:hypothetical protein
MSVLTHIPEPTLKKGRAEGDCPKLYGVGRALFTTIVDVQEWILGHELQPGQMLRPATIPKGAKFTPEQLAARKAKRTKAAPTAPKPKPKLNKTEPAVASS